MAADTGMDMCSSPETPDSRKRPLDCDTNRENGTTKRSHYGGDGDSLFHFKILVPNVASGAIIGKGGETIAQLQKDTDARIKMSKANDFYPRTTERVCLISGGKDSIIAALLFIMEKIREKPEISGGKQTASDMMDVKVKILIPNSTAGMIIGKGGAYIKQIKEESGSYVQISQKTKDQSLQERCITVIGEIENNKTACMMILDKVIEDPSSGTCLNVSYTDITGTAGNYNTTESPYRHNTTAKSFSNSRHNNMAGSQMMMNGGLGGGINLSLDLNSPFVGASQLVTSKLLEIRMLLHSRGYSERASNEILSAMSTLSKYSLLGLGMTGNASNSGMLSANLFGVSPMDATPIQSNQMATSSGVYGPIGTNPAARSGLDLPFDSYRHQNGYANHGTLNNNNTFGLGAYNKDGYEQNDTKKVELNVPEVIIGAILGRGGRSLVEIQLVSGANIQISKKGVYAPGTTDRIVTISGNVSAISTAQYVIEQRISGEEAKRSVRLNAMGDYQD